MPVIIFEGPVLSPEKKTRIIREFSQLATDITGIPKEAYVIFIKENSYDNMGQGGLTIAEKLKLQ